MTVETTTTGADTTTSAPETTSSAAAESSAPEGNVEVSTPSSQDAAPAPYAPNLKFKVHDKEMEFDPWVQGVIKDAETEKRVRELYEKAHGLDHVKADRTKLRDENMSIKTELKQTHEGLQQLGGILKKKDFDSFFEALKVQEDDVLKWALQVAQRRQNPQLHAQWQHERQYQNQLAELQTQNQQLLSQHEQVAVQAKTFEMNQVMARPDVQQAAHAFDNRVGRPGAFYEEVIKRGQYHHFTSGQDVAAEQAVNEVLALVGAASQAPQVSHPAQPQVMSAQGQTGQPSQAPEKKPVIPNIQGRGTSPAAKVPRSLDDLRRMAQERGA